MVSIKPTKSAGKMGKVARAPQPSPAVNCEDGNEGAPGAGGAPSGLQEELEPVDGSGASE